MPYSPADQPRHRPGSRLLYSLLSAIIPGTGQLVSGRRRCGAIMVVVSLVIIAAGLIAYAQGTSRLLSYLVQPRILIAVFILNVAVFAFRLGSVVDAFWSPEPDDGRKPRGWQGGMVAVALVGMLGLTAAPHAVLGYYTYLTYDTLQQVFSVESLADELEEERQRSLSPDPTPTPTPDEDPDADSRGDPDLSRSKPSGIAWAGVLVPLAIAPGHRGRHEPDAPGPYP